MPRPGGFIKRRGRSHSRTLLGRALHEWVADVWAPTFCPHPPRLDFSTQTRGAGLVTSLVPRLVTLAVLSSVLGGVQAAKLRPQHEYTLPFYPYRYGLPSERSGHAMATAADGSVWMFGGVYYSWHGSTSTSTLFDDLHKLDLQERRWHNITTTGRRPRGRYSHAMASVANGTMLLVFGGSFEGMFHNQVLSDEAWSFNMLNAEWSQLTGGATGEWPSARERHAMAAVSDTRVLLFGGYTASGRSDELWSLDVPGTSWTQLTAGASGAWPRGRRDHAMAAVSDTRVILFGGSTASGKSDELLSLDFLAAANHTVRWTRLNDEKVTAEELWEQFNNGQVGGCCVGVSVEDSLS